MLTRLFARLTRTLADQDIRRGSNGSLMHRSRERKVPPADETADAASVAAAGWSRRSRRREPLTQSALLLVPWAPLSGRPASGASGRERFDAWRIGLSVPFHRRSATKAGRLLRRLGPFSPTPCGRFLAHTPARGPPARYTGRPRRTLASLYRTAMGTGSHLDPARPGRLKPVRGRADPN